MKSIIQRKTYDTETATRLHEWGNGYSCRDFHHCTETLYRTKNGALFLHGQGGAMSKYSEACGNMRGGGEQIIPLTTDESIDWLEQHDGADAILEHFGGAIEDA